MVVRVVLFFKGDFVETTGSAIPRVTMPRSAYFAVHAAASIPAGLARNTFNTSSPRDVLVKLRDVTTSVPLPNAHTHTISLSRSRSQGWGGGEERLGENAVHVTGEKCLLSAAFSPPNFPAIDRSWLSRRYLAQPRVFPFSPV